MLLNQLIATLTTNNIPVVNSITAGLIPDGLPKSVKDIIQISDDIDHTHIDMALVEPAILDYWRENLAKRHGAIVTIIETNARQEIPLWRLLAERAICTNTTAAGGNASLMTLGN